MPSFLLLPLPRHILVGIINTAVQPCRASETLTSDLDGRGGKDLKMEFHGRLLNPQTACQRCSLNCKLNTEKLHFNAQKLYFHQLCYSDAVSSCVKVKKTGITSPYVTWLAPHGWQHSQCESCCVVFVAYLAFIFSLINVWVWAHAVQALYSGWSITDR